MRSDEAAVLEWSDFDLERGAVRLDHNKTNDPRAWALQPGTARAMRAWKAYRRALGDTGPSCFRSASSMRPSDSANTPRLPALTGLSCSSGAATAPLA
jgi:integrase